MPVDRFSSSIRHSELELSEDDWLLELEPDEPLLELEEALLDEGSLLELDGALLLESDGPLLDSDETLPELEGPLLDPPPPPELDELLLDDELDELLLELEELELEELLLELDEPLLELELDELLPLPDGNTTPTSAKAGPNHNIHSHSVITHGLPCLRFSVYEASVCCLSIHLIAGRPNCIVASR